MLSNVILLPALSILYSSYHQRNLADNTETTRISAVFMLLAVAVFTIPTDFDDQTNMSVTVVSALSRGTSLILILAYRGYLAFYPFQQSQFSKSATSLADELKHPRLAPVSPGLGEHRTWQYRLWVSFTMFIISLTTLSYFVIDKLWVAFKY